MRLLERDELEPLATGAWILGAGGGNPYLAYLNLCRLYDQGTKVALLDPMALGDDDPVAIVSGVEAPLVGRERLSDPRFATKPLLAMQSHLKCRFRAVMSVEIGGTNALQPLMVAAMTGLPVVDADSMGRAFPEGHMMSFAIAGLPALPLAMADIRNTDVIVPQAENPQWMSRIARKVLGEMGAVLFAGKVQDIERRTTVVWRDGAVVATRPDIICVMDSEAGEAIGTEMIRCGQRVTVIVLPVPDFFLTPQGLAATGPRAFGYDFDYKSGLSDRGVEP